MYSLDERIQHALTDKIRLRNQRGLLQKAIKIIVKTLVNNRFYNVTCYLQFVVQFARFNCQNLYRYINASSNKFRRFTIVVCLSIRLSVCSSIRPSVCLFVSSQLCFLILKVGRYWPERLYKQKRKLIGQLWAMQRQVGRAFEKLVFSSTFNADMFLEVRRNKCLCLNINKVSLK